MQLVVRYEYEEGRYVWPIPFGYGDISEVGVRLVLPSGRERVLRAGTDYACSGSQIVYVLPRQHSLVIYRDGLGSIPQGSRSGQVLPEEDLGCAPCQAVSAAVNSCEMKSESELAQALRDISGQLARLEEKQSEDIASLRAETVRLAAARPVAALLDGQDNSDKPDGQAGSASTPDSAVNQDTGTAREIPAAVARDAQAAASAASLTDPDNTPATPAAPDLLARLATKAELALEDIDVAAEEVEQSIMAKASGLVAAMRLADDSAAAVQAAVASAGDAALEAADAAVTAREDAEAVLNELTARVAELEARLDKRAAAANSAVALAAVQAEEQVAAASERAAAQAYSVSRLAGQAWPEQGYLILPDDLAARSVMALPDPLRYYPGRNSLYVARNGFVQTLGREFEEVGTAAQASNTIRLLVECRSGDVLSFLVMPTNQAQAASESATDAARSANEAAGYASKAAGSLGNVQTVADRAVTQGNAQLANINSQGSQAVRNVTLLRDNALDEIRSLTSSSRQDAAIFWQALSADVRKDLAAESEAARKIWQDARLDIADVRKEAQARAEACLAECERNTRASGHAASQSQELAECAWAAAYQASLARTSPGIGTVSSMEQLDGMPSGIYIINPRCYGPLPFMGVYPVTDLEDTNSDGFFLVGAIPWPDQPPAPDIPFPEDPAEIPAMNPPAALDHWLPCQHKHGE